ncbi:Acid sphingomyelinase-like phosphodiesterase 3b [Toxocara canis]|uniref:Acid sphingomyelinase-like phosphodiesterase 3b n=1 Tax=Toxocara canis TaxID=6265 RepID=A0A0B2UTS0_TOXCA|nr:Acid sphingomyelinase-like phosphodiesterase 3b [Toxocara canis]
MFITVILFAISYTNAARFLQLTDIHYDRDYSAQWGNVVEKCHRKTGVPRSKLGQYGNYACHSPKSLIRNMLAAAKKVISNPDFVFWTGDSVSHLDNSNNETHVLKELQVVSDMVANTFPQAKILPVFGIHDSAPAGAFPDRNCSLYNNVYKLWKRWIGANNKETFLKGGYYKYQAPNNMMILALNTNLYYKFNRAIPTFANSDDPAEQFNFMQETLNEAQRQQRVVHVIAHTAPGAFERIPNFTWMLPKYNKRFIQLTIRYARVIKWMLFGHHHTDTFHVVKDPKTNRAMQVYLLAPAVTPWFGNLENSGSNNPSFRVFDYDSNNKELLDVKTYYVDLNQLNKNASTQWQLEYSMAQAYGINAINANTMSNALNQMKTDDETFRKYIEYNTVRWNYSIPTGKFRGAQLCSMEYVDFALYKSCMSNWTSTVAAGF